MTATTCACDFLSAGTLTLEVYVAMFVVYGVSIAMFKPLFDIAVQG